jgi:hypothetical protein
MSPQPEKSVTLELNGELLLLLRREAAKRETSALRLARQLLDVIIAEDLVGAVLDVDEDG